MIEKLDNTYFLQLINGLKYDEKNDLYSFNGKTYKYKGKGLLFESRKRYAYYFMNTEDTKEIINVTGANDIPLYDGFNQINIDRALRSKCVSRYSYLKYTLPKVKKQQEINAQVRQAWKNEVKKQKEAEAEELRKKKREELEKKLQPKPCAFCGKVFKPIQTQQKFCCAECRIKFFSRKQGLEITESHQQDKKCIICGKQFRGTQRQKYCSDKCEYTCRLAMDKAKRKVLKELQDKYQNEKN